MKRKAFILPVRRRPMMGARRNLRRFNHTLRLQWRGAYALLISSSNFAAHGEILGSSSAGRLDHNERLDQGCDPINIVDDLSTTWIALPIRWQVL